MRRIKIEKRSNRTAQTWRNPRAIVSLAALAGILGLWVALMADSYRSGQTVSATAVGLYQAQSEHPGPTFIRARLEDGRIVVLGESEGVLCVPGQRLLVREVTSRIFRHRGYQFIGFEGDADGARD
jgi:hypothetical protein